MHDSLRAGHRVTLERVGIFADGVAVRRVGEETFRLAQQYVDEVILVIDRRDLRRDPGHLRGQPHHRRAGRRARRGGDQEVRRARGLHRPHAGRAQLRCEHQFRPAAARRGAGRHRRAGARHCWRSRSPSSRAASCASASCSGRRSVTEFNYRYDDASAARDLRRHRAARGRAREGRPAADGRRGGLHGARHERRRDGEAARALHGGRPRPGHRARAAVPFRVPGTARVRCSSSCRRSARAGTSACSTTATTARTTVACWRACRCRRPMPPSSRSTCATCSTPTPRRPATRPTACSSAAEAVSA